MKKKLLITLGLLVSLLSNAQRNDRGLNFGNTRLPANLEGIASWDLLPGFSDDFNHNNKNSAKFQDVWSQSYLPDPGFRGPGSTRWVGGNSVEVRNGELEVIARPGPGGLVDCGIVSSNRTIQFPVYMEARIRASNIRNSSNFWMLNECDNEEIDVLEVYGGDPDPFYSKQMSTNFHIWHRRGGQSHAGAQTNVNCGGQDITDFTYQTFFTTDPEVSDLNSTDFWRDDYHTFGVYWASPTQIEFYIDGQPRFNGQHYVDGRNASGLDGSFNDARMQCPNAAVLRCATSELLRNVQGQSGGGVPYPNREFNDPTHLIIDTEAHAGRPVESVANLNNNSRNVMRVDWVRVYRPTFRDPNTPTPPVVATPATPTPPVVVTTPTTTNGSSIVIEAEDFAATGGTTDDAEFGGSGLGVNRRATTVNFVNTGDYIEYNINVATAGAYTIEYLISTPSDNSQIQFLVDGVLASTTNVPNNGDWEAYRALRANGTANLSVGAHTIRINASGEDLFQWNLDRITLANSGASTPEPAPTPVPAPPVVVTPPAPTNGASLVIEAENFVATNGTINDAEFGGSGLGVNRRATTVNFVNTGDYAEYNLNVTTAGAYAIEYLISTPSDNSQIQFVVDGVLASTTNVPNNGDWEAYRTLNASGTVNLSAGVHTIRINASGTNFWQWNLDRVTLTIEASAKALTVDDNITLYPNPAVDTIYLNGIEEYSEAIIYNLSGTAIRSINLTTNNSSFDVSQLSNGVYIVKIVGANNALQILKVVVSH